MIGNEAENMHMRPIVNRGCVYIAMCVAPLACVHLNNGPPLAAAAAAARQPATPLREDRNSSQMLRDLGVMLKVYLRVLYPGINDDPYLIGLAHVSNDGREPTMATELRFLIRQLVDYAGSQFATIMLGDPIISNAPPVYRTSEATDAPKLRPIYKLTGAITDATRLAASERVIRTDGNLKRPVADGSWSFAQSGEIKELGVVLTLENEMGLSQSGRTATFRVSVEQHERGSSASIYVNGSGAGFDTKVTGYQSTSAAVQDAMAESLARVLATEFELPLWRLTSGDTTRDEEYTRQLSATWSRLSRFEVLLKLKSLYFLAGAAMDVAAGPAPTEGDLRLLAEAFHRASLEQVTFGELVADAMRLWAGLDWRVAAVRVDSVRTRVAHERRDAQVDSMRRAVATSVRVRSSRVIKERPVLRPPRSASPPPRKPSTPSAAKRTSTIRCAASQSPSRATVTCSVEAPAKPAPNQQRSNLPTGKQ